MGTDCTSSMMITLSQSLCIRRTDEVFAENSVFRNCTMVVAMTGLSQRSA